MFSGSMVASQEEPIETVNRPIDNSECVSQGEHIPDIRRKTISMTISQFNQTGETKLNEQASQASPLSARL